MSNSKRMYAGLVCVVCLALLAGCSGHQSIWEDIGDWSRERNQEPEKPGLYSLDGWNGAPDNGGKNRWAPDVNGEVGHSLYVNGPRSKCVPSGRTLHNSRITSGSLPPGLTLGIHAITGTPTERGHWIVKLEAYNVQCNDRPYAGFEQELRFHITGSGKVVQ